MSDWGWLTFLIFSAVGNLAVVIISLLPPPQAFPRIHVRESWRQARSTGGDDGNEHRGWAGITLFVPAFLNNEVNIPQKVIASDWGRGRLGYVVTVVIKQFSCSAIVIGISYMCTYITCVFFLCSIHPYKRKTHLECKTLLYSSSMWGTSLINLQIHSDVGLINIPPLRASSVGWMLL